MLPALPGSLVGVPRGIGLFAVTNGAGEVSVPAGPRLVAVVLGTLAAVAALTAVPAVLGARQPAVLILRSEAA
jgi:putative ABC transport system permease protein